MAWYSGAIKMELQPESDAQPAIRPTQFIVHSLAAPWTARRTYEFWRDSTNLESHFALGYKGDLAQFIGTETRADANAAANLRPDGTGAISLESASNLDATDPWTDEQVEALIKVGVWAHQRHGIPLRICRTPDDPGFGWHKQFDAWNPNGHACPGPARIKQFKEVVFPGIVARATSPAPAPQEDNEMQLSDQIHLGDWIPKHWPNDKGLQDKQIPVDVALGSGYAHSRKAAENTTVILAQLGAQQATIDKLVAAIGSGSGLTAAEIQAAAEAGAQAALDRLSDALKEN